MKFAAEKKTFQILQNVKIKQKAFVLLTLAN